MNLNDLRNDMVEIEAEIAKGQSREILLTKMRNIRERLDRTIVSLALIGDLC